MIACGARYRRLDVANLADFEGTAIHYWASPIEAKLCGDQVVALVGAGNSAGQAAVYLAEPCSQGLDARPRQESRATMSRYLVERIAAQSNIEVLTQTEVHVLNGEDGHLESIGWRNRETGEQTTRAIRHLFLFIGADPNTDWLGPSGSPCDAKGFVLTGAHAGADRHSLESSPCRHLRDRRRSRRLGQKGGCRGGRGCPGGGGNPCPPCRNECRPRGVSTAGGG